MTVLGATLAKQERNLGWTETEGAVAKGPRSG